MSHSVVCEKLDYTTLCDAVLKKISDEIYDGKLKPGQRLQQTELAQRFGISRMPVRDALRKLEAEGLVTVYPGRGAVVAVLDVDECQEVYRIREALECLAACLAAPKITDEDLASLKSLVDEMEKASRSGDVGLWLQLDKAFHNRCYQACNSPRLLNMIAGLWNSTQHFRRAYCRVPGGFERAEEAHRRVLAVLSVRDGELFANLIRDHLRASVRSIVEAEKSVLHRPHLSILESK